jgi:ribosomal protein L40E
LITCGECGERNDDGEKFCGSCGAFLGWQAAPQTADAHPPVASGGGSPRVPITEELPLVPVPVTPRNGAGNAPPGPAKRQGKADSISTVAGGGPSIEEGEPVAVKPEERRVRAPVEPRDAEVSPPAAGDLICATCGTGNPADRHFCRRCAASLSISTAAVTPSSPWWRRYFGHTNQKALPAGTRPKWKTRHFPAKAVAGLTVAGLLGGGAYAGRDVPAAAVQRVRDEFSDIEIPRDQIKLLASSNLQGRDADFAKDGTTVRSWAAKLEKPEPYLQAEFDRSFRLVYVFITGGLVEPPQGQNDRMALKVRISVTEKPDEPEPSYREVAQVEVGNGTGRQGFYVGAEGVKAVRITVLDPPSSQGYVVTVAEVQFSRRR